MDSDKKMTISLIKSIIVSVKGGLPFYRLEGDYREQNGERIPFAKYGFTSLDEFLRSIPEVNVSKANGTMMLTVRDPKMDHITSLLNRQKAPRKRVSKKMGFSSRSSCGRPIVRQHFRGGHAPRPGYPSRPTVNTSRRPSMGNTTDSYRRPPLFPDPPQYRPPPIRDVPYEYRTSQPPTKYAPKGHEMGNGDGPRAQPSNLTSRRPVTGYQPDANRDRAEVQAYSNTHLIRQGKGFVEYVPLDDSVTLTSTKRNEQNTTSNANCVPLNGKIPLQEVHCNALDVKQGQERAKPVDAQGMNGVCQVQTVTLGRGRGIRTVAAHSVAKIAHDLSKVSVSRWSPPSPIIYNLPKNPQHLLNGSTTSGVQLHDLELEDEDYEDDGESDYFTKRTVDYKRGTTLSITIPNDCANVAFNDDNDSLKNDEDIEDDDGNYVRTSYQKLVFRPKIFNHQLIGDDFLLHFANSIDEPCLQIDGSLVECGLCMSGMTLDMCKDSIREAESLEQLSDRLIILVGAIDILQGIKDQSLLVIKMNALVGELTSTKQCVYICTIPPLDHLNTGSEHIRKRYNNFIRSLATEKMKVIDLDTAPFVDSANKMCNEYFEEFDLETVSQPDSAPVQLKMWNKHGLETIRDVLKKSLEIKK